MIAATGWTWEQVGQLTLHRYYALCAYWRDHPPLHIMVAAYLGIKPEEKPDQQAADKPKEMTEAEKAKVAELFAFMGQPLPNI